MANLCTSLVTQKDYEVFVRSRVKYLRRGDLQFNSSSSVPKSKLLFSAILTFLFLPELQAIKKPTIKHLFFMPHAFDHLRRLLTPAYDQ